MQVERISNKKVKCSICEEDILIDKPFVYHLEGIRLLPVHPLCKSPCEHIFFKNLSSPDENYCIKCGQIE